MIIWVKSWRRGCLITWFCCQLIAKPGNNTASLPWQDPHLCLHQNLPRHSMSLWNFFLAGWRHSKWLMRYHVISRYIECQDLHVDDTHTQLIYRSWWCHQINIFRVTGPLWGESIGHQWIPLTKAIGVELSYFLWSSPEQTVKQTI